MFTLIFKKDGDIYKKSWCYDKVKNDGYYEETLLSENINVLSMLSITVDLEDGYTLRDYFKTILKYYQFQLLDNYFNTFITEYVSCPNFNCVCDDVKEIVIKKIITFTDSFKTSIEINAEIEEAIHVYGNSNDMNTTYSLSFIPLKELLDLPIKFKDAIYCYENFKNGFKSAEYKQYEGKYSYTLFDFITSIIYELSFWGSPEEQERKKNKILNITKDITINFTKELENE